MLLNEILAFVTPGWIVVLIPCVSKEFTKTLNDELKFKNKFLRQTQNWQQVESIFKILLCYHTSVSLLKMCVNNFRQVNVTHTEILCIGMAWVGETRFHVDVQAEHVVIKRILRKWTTLCTLANAQAHSECGFVPE